MKKILLLCLFSGCILLSCDITKPISSTPPANNASYMVEYLFEHEGVKVYRFRDEGGYVYFTKPVGNVTAIATDSTKRVIRSIQLPQ